MGCDCVCNRPPKLPNCHLPWSWSRHTVQFLRKSRSTLIFSLAGDSLKKPFDSFAQFFTKWHKFFSTDGTHSKQCYKNETFLIPLNPLLLILYLPPRISCSK